MRCYVFDEVLRMLFLAKQLERPQSGFWTGVRQRCMRMLLKCLGLIELTRFYQPVERFVPMGDKTMPWKRKQVATVIQITDCTYSETLRLEITGPYLPGVKTTFTVVSTSTASLLSEYGL